MLLEGAPDTAAFEAYIEHCLAPSLVPGRIVLMDNLSAHKSARTRALIAARGCDLWYLPAYAPDFSPIEHAFSKLKALLRGAAARTQQALEQITAADAHGWFAHCG